MSKSNATTSQHVTIASHSDTSTAAGATGGGDGGGGTVNRCPKRASTVTPYKHKRRLTTLAATCSSRLTLDIWSAATDERVCSQGFKSSCNFRWDFEVLMGQLQWRPLTWHDNFPGIAKRLTNYRDPEPPAPKFLETTEKFLPWTRAQIPLEKLKKLKSTRKPLKEPLFSGLFL